ncbi:MAG: TonB-dependent receptor plug domain-containing protein [Rhodomicrobium sp.]|nr:TonB-dependent receptor plug domain-containing protein [Rhodomicrobium sp.]
MKKQLLLSVAAMAIATSSDRVLAQEGQADLQDNGTIVLEGIVIEGEKIPREFVDTFSSVGVVTAEDIETYKVDDLRDSFNLEANVRWNEGDRGNSGIVIRGLNSDGLTGTNNSPLTSVIIDGATQSKEAAKRGTRGTWDVKQIEIFRGPQSTLQGRNSLAGAIIIETNDPTYNWEVGGQGTLGDYERKDGAFFVSGPISTINSHFA